MQTTARLHQQGGLGHPRGRPGLKREFLLSGAARDGQRVRHSTWYPSVTSDVLLPYLTGSPLCASVTASTRTSQMVRVAENSTCGGEQGGGSTARVGWGGLAYWRVFEGGRRFVPWQHKQQKPTQVRYPSSGRQTCRRCVCVRSYLKPPCCA